MVEGMLCGVEAFESKREGECVRETGREIIWCVH